MEYRWKNNSALGERQSGFQESYREGMTFKYISLGEQQEEQPLNYKGHFGHRQGCSVLKQWWGFCVPGTSETGIVEAVMGDEVCCQNPCISNLFGLYSVMTENLHRSEYLEHLLSGLQIFHHLFSCQSSVSKKVTLVIWGRKRLVAWRPVKRLLM